MFFAVSLLGENGVQESNTDGELKLKVTGGELLGFGSAAPRTEREFTDGVYPSRYGKALAAVRPDGGKTLTLTLDSGTQKVQKTFHEGMSKSGMHPRNYSCPYQKEDPVIMPVYR